MTGGKYQISDRLSKKIDFFEKQEQKEADIPEIKGGCSFFDKETYDSLPLTRRLDMSGGSYEDHPELLTKETRIKLLLNKIGIPM